MYQQQKALFLYCVSPVHMGAGTAIGLIDNPIQRERHTNHPLFAGSGLKGAIRHCFQATWDEAELNHIFGPENSEYAGAVSFGDAQLVAFPVRCTKRAFLYATSPLALARARRQLELLGRTPDWTIPDVGVDQCCVVPASELATETQLNLELFQYQKNDGTRLDEVAEWLAENALPPHGSYDFFRRKLKSDLVLLPDEDFTYYVKNSTVVEPHVRINCETGTAEDGGLFYTENLPPESLLMAPMMTSPTRGNNAKMDAKGVMEKILNGLDERSGLDGQCLQIGGNATTGRGQIVITSVKDKQ